MVYTHRGAYLASLGGLAHAGHSSASVYLWTLPMFHCNGWCTAWAVTAAGGTQVCLRDVRGEPIWQLIDAHGVTHLNGAPTVVTTIMNAERARRLDRPLVITTAGAPPSPTTIQQMEEMGFTIIHVYGLTETYGPYAVCEPQPAWKGLAPEERARRMSRQGVGMVHTDGLRVVESELRDGALVDVPADGRPRCHAPRRLRRAARPRQGRRRVRWREHRDRRGRACGGERWGERPKAFVVLRPGESVSTAALLQHVRTKIAHYKAPREIEFLTELPKTSTGKIQKFDLREKEWWGHTRRIHG